MSHVSSAAPVPARARLAGWLLAAAAVYFLYFFGLTGAGMLGPDEPRYAAIGREMARSGDWVTPRLWGEPWFEKPALLYWMTGLGFRAGLGPDLAPRLPVALLSAAFLLFFYLTLRREFNTRAAFYSTAILATSAAWIAYSSAGVTDLPMTAAFSAAMLLCLPWVRTGDRRNLTFAAALFGIALLAKGLVPLVLALPLAWFGRKRLLDWLRPRPLAAFFAVAAPWYVLCYAHNGWPFIEDFFIKHHFSRFATDALQHRQPFWFYVPVLLGGLFPWTPLVGLLGRKSEPDPRRRYLAAWVLFGFVFFSASTNKLPGYLLPLVPPLAVLLGMALDGAKKAGVALAACAALLAAVPVIARILPQALARGITHSNPGGVPWLSCAAVLALCAVAWWSERLGRRMLAFACVAAAMTGAVVYLKVQAMPVLDRAVSTRAFWRGIESQRADICVHRMNRTWRYNLNYYSDTPLPDCAAAPRRLHIFQEGGRAPELR